MADEFGAFGDQFFNSNFYLQNNPDVLSAIAAGDFSSALQHFELYGQYEGRAPNSTFNEHQYLLDNPDVLAAVNAGYFTSGYEHFVLYGEVEGRNDGSFTGTFDNATYLADNPDVAAAVANGYFTSGYEHWLLYGHNEVRDGGPTSNNPGTSFQLTTGMDVITPSENNTSVNPTSFPSTGNDTFMGTVAPTGSTLTNGDDLDGGGGANTLMITDTAGTDTNDLAGVTLANIQTVSVENASAGTVTADFAPAPTVSKIIALSTAAGGIDNFTNLATGAQVIASGADTAPGSTVNIAMAIPTAAVFMGVDGGVSGLSFNNDFGTETAATISSTGSSNGTTGAPDQFGVAGGSANVATLTVDAATNLVASLFISDYAPASDLTVSGAAPSVNLISDAGESAFQVVNASGLTGGGLTITTGPELTKLTGGAGDDVITLGGDTTGATVTGGAGGMDTFDGGGGNNTFVFMAAPGAGNLTTISAFAPGSDMLGLSRTAFSALTEATTALSANDFVTAPAATALDGGSVAAATTAAAIVYLQDTGALYYNADGAAAGGLTQIGELSGTPQLALADIKVTA